MGFRQRSDTAGEVAATASIVDSIYIENRYFVAMDPWIEILERRLKALESLSSPGLELRVYSSAVIAMLYRQPGNPLMPMCLERLVSLIETEGDPNSRVSAAISVLTYASASGDFAAGHRVHALVEPTVDNEEVAPFHRFLWRVWIGYFQMMLGEFETADANYAMAEALNNESQFPWSANLLFCRVLSLIGQGNTRSALENLDRMEAISNRSSPSDLGYLHVAQAWKGLINGDPEMAKGECEAALALAETMGNFSLTVIWQVPLIWALARTDRYEAFLHAMEVQLGRVRNTCYRRPHVEWLAMKAWLHLRRGEHDIAREVLAEGLELAKNLNHGAFFHRLSHFAPELRDFAFSSHVDVDFVRCLVRKFNWPAPSPKIETGRGQSVCSTLGRFSICVDDRPLSFAHKAPKKPISVLKAIIALGERGVSQERLIDALWADEAGDAAHHAFALALHRLRRLLGHADTITVENGAVSLDWSRVWTDARAFEAVVETSASAVEEGGDRITNLYRGHFLAGDQDEPWSLSRRERLRAKFLNAVDRQGRELENAARLDSAVAVYLRGLDAEPLAETFYQGLIRCYAAQGKQAEAFSTYRRLRHALSVALGRQPSAITEALVRVMGEH